MKKKSALLGLPDSQEIKIYPNRSHTTICKFDGENDPVWEQVSDILYHGALSALEYTGYRPIVGEWAMDVDDDIRHSTGGYHIDKSHQTH